MHISDFRLAMAQFFGLDKVAKLRTIIKVCVSKIKEHVGTRIFRIMGESRLLSTTSTGLMT